VPRKYSSTSIDTTIVTTALSASATSLTVSNAANLTNGLGYATSDTFIIAISPDTATEEICIVTGVSSNTLTITRAQGGTSAQTHSIGSIVRHVLTSIELTDFETVRTNHATITGTETLTNKTLTSPSLSSPSISNNVQIAVSAGLGTTGTIALDFATEGFKSHSGNLTGNITYTASNYAAGRSITVRVPNGATLRTLAFPTDWKFVGVKPVNIAASKTGILTVTSFGTTEADCVAAWAVEA
jgi:hypothetical protein